MSVKVIVTDMDGTFLNDAKTYNQPRFMAQYQELKKRGIPAERITKISRGGIADYLPTEANRHTKVELF